MLDTDQTRRLVDRLRCWADGSRRDLPWRRTRDPWAILVSETMLQQTQVDRVVPRYVAFLERFPTPAACARATAADVVTAWSGLGYNRRAVNLHRAATIVVREHGGEMPSGLDELLALPGVGGYTARAVQVFAFERDIGVVDTNVGRILARLGGSRLTSAEAQDTADRLVPRGHGWAWNQALFDLGAIVCTKRVPRCDSCPVVELCAWRGRGADPAAGSAATTKRQSRFEGSFRQGRGRLVAALRDGPVDLATVAPIVAWDDSARVAACVASLVDDGLIVVNDGLVELARG